MIWVRMFILGLGFFAISAVWPMYNSYMPLFYGHFIGSLSAVGAIMGIDNVLGLTMQPYFGALSDQTRTRFGRRIPFLLVGMPLAAVLLGLLPYTRDIGLLPLLLSTIVMNVMMAVFRSPTVALMPDVVPAHLRSQANGIINFMGGLGAIVSILVGSKLYERDPHLPFVFVGGMMLVVAVIFLLWIREPAESAETVEETPAALKEAFVSLFRIRDPQVLLLMAAIFLWTFAEQGLETWFTTYGTRVLGLSAGDASGKLRFFLVSFVFLTLPVGFLSGWVGRRRAMSLGAVLLAVGVGLIGFVPALLLPALVTAGAGWALVIVNAYPAMVQLAGPAQVGTFTGMYYVAGPLAAAISPTVFGSVVDILGWPAAFGMAVVAFLLAAVTVLRVDGADVSPADAKAA